MTKPRKIVVDGLEWVWKVRPKGKRDKHALFQPMVLGAYCKETKQYIKYEFSFQQMDYHDEPKSGGVTPQRVAEIIRQNQVEVK